MSEALTDGAVSLSLLMHNEQDKLSQQNGSAHSKRRFSFNSAVSRFFRLSRTTSGDSNAAKPLSFGDAYRFVGVLGTGAQGVILLATHRWQETTTAFVADVDAKNRPLLFPGNEASFPQHIMAANREYLQRNSCEDSSESGETTADDPPLYVAIKRVHMNAAAVAHAHKTPPSPAKDAAERYKLRGTLGLGEMLSTETKLLQRYVDETTHAKSVIGQSSDMSLPKNAAKEIRAMQKLNHPHIVQLYDVFYTPQDQTMYLVTEYVSGGDLATSMKQKMLPRSAVKREEYARATLRAIASALEYMHTQGFAHRDLKPANILVGPPVKMCDLGFSNDAAAMCTKLGTADYMAPELVLSDGIKPYDVKIDCWSLGVIAYELLAPHNERPFTGRTPGMLSNSILRIDVYYGLLQTDTYSVSDECVSFVKALLCEEKKRLSARDVLEHAWLFKSNEKRWSMSSSSSSAASAASVASAGADLTRSNSGAVVTLASLMASGGVDGDSTPPSPAKRKGGSRAVKRSGLHPIAEEH